MSPYTCTRCRQVTIPAELVEEMGRSSVWTVPAVCESCRKLERQPQGENMRLFEPAPNQMPGQLGFA
jgi:hypothetical protein